MVNSRDRAQAIFFFDHNCGFCQRTVRVLQSIDRSKTIYYAPLGGETFRHYLTDVSFGDSSIFYQNGISWTHSGAILAALDTCGGPWRHLSRILGWTPSFLREGVYSLFVQFRGQSAPENCVLPTAALKAKLLP